MSPDLSVRLLDVARRSGQLSAAQLTAFTKSFPPGSDARTLARQLVRCQALTTFQANRIAQGQADSLFLGPYLLLDKLGEGGMGQVFKGRHEKLGRLAAIKVIRPDRLTHPDALKRFEREARAVARLSHPAVVGLYEIGETRKTHFIALEYVVGTTLSELVARSGVPAIPQACDYARQAALGLQHAHEQGVLHRDIKPSNLLLTSSGQVKVLDMGLATFLGDDPDDGSLTSDGSFLGTPDYVAPEQATDARTADIRSDIYSLGCSLYFLLTGRPPFAGGTSIQKVVWHQQAEPPAVESLRKDVPASLATAVRRMMAKQPAARFQLPVEAATALSAFCVLQPISTAAIPVATILPTEHLSAPQALPVVRQDTETAHATAVVPPAARRKRPFVIAGLVVLALALLLWWRPWQAGTHSPVPGELFVEPHRPVGEVFCLKGHTGDITALALSEDGQRLLSGSSVGEICLWDLTTGQELKTMSAAPKDIVTALQLSSDRRFGLSGDAFGVVRSWDLDNAREQRRLVKGSSTVQGVRFLPDNRVLSLHSHYTVRLWNPKDESIVRDVELRGLRFDRLVFVPGQQQAVLFGDVAVGQVEYMCVLYDLVEFKEIKRFAKHAQNFYAAAIAPEQQRLLTGSVDNLLRLWDVWRDSIIRTFEGHQKPVHSVALAADARTALSASADGTVKYWALPWAGKPVNEPVGELHSFKGHEGAVGVVLFSRSERRAISGGADKTIRVWALPR